MTDWDSLLVEKMRDYLFEVAQMYGHDTAVYASYGNGILMVFVCSSENLFPEEQEIIVNQLLFLRENLLKMFTEHEENTVDQF